MSASLCSKCWCTPRKQSSTLLPYLQHRPRRRLFSNSAKLRQSFQVQQDAAPSPAELLNKFVSVSPSQITLHSLTRFGYPPLTSKDLLTSAEYTRQELPHRLSRRVLAHRALPYIVGTNPHIAKIHKLYHDSLETLAAVQPIHTLEQNDAFVEILGGLVQAHSDNIPTLAQGFQESRRYMSPPEIEAFLSMAIRSRISIRLIAEHHLSLSAASSPESQGKVKQSLIGIVDTECCPAQMIKGVANFVGDLCDGTYGRSPHLILDGDADATFAYVPVHLEYMLTEILKNSYRATIEKCSAYTPPPPVRVTIAHDADNASLALRVRDQGGGISPAHLKEIFSYAFTTVSTGEEDEDEAGPYAAQNASGGAAIFDGLTKTSLQGSLGTIAGLGYGLPLSRLYAEYFGGSLHLHSLAPHGTDLFVTLRSCN